MSPPGKWLIKSPFGKSEFPHRQTLSRLAAAEEGTRAFAGVFRAPDVIKLLARGDPEQPRDEVQPAVLSALGDLTLPAQSGEQERRRALADWIADARNPLTARVMANRVWLHLMGRAIVDTPDNFGRSGSAPTHRELLDHLALRLRELAKRLRHQAPGLLALDSPIGSFRRGAEWCSQTIRVGAGCPFDGAHHSEGCARVSRKGALALRRRG